MKGLDLWYGFWGVENVLDVKNLIFLFLKNYREPFIPIFAG